nr:response regulator transcription factor [Devosia oryzisoli]
MVRSSARIVIDDHPVLRAGLVQLLRVELSFDIVAEGGSVREAVDLARKLQPDLLLLDLSMEQSGLEAIGQIVEVAGKTKIIIVTASDAAYDVQTALDRGVSGYLLKGSTGAEILDAVALVSEGKDFVSPRAMSRAIMAARDGAAGPHSRLSSLSPRERTVLEMMASGLSNRDIGTKLGIAEKSVKFHVTNIFSKVGVRNRVEAVLAYNGTIAASGAPHQ